MKTRTHDLTAGSIPQHMLRLAAPLILGNILQQLYNAVDAFILGRCAGGLEFAAVGIAGSVMNLFLFMITGACTGVSVIFAQLFGANDLETFRREHFLSLVFGLLCTLACSAIGFLCLPLLLRVIQTPQELTGYVTAYLTVILISLPAAFVYNLYGALQLCHRFTPVEPLHRQAPRAGGGQYRQHGHDLCLYGHDPHRGLCQFVRRQRRGGDIGARGAESRCR